MSIVSRRNILRALVYLPALTIPQFVIAMDFGRFVGDIEVRWLDDGRNMQTLTDFEYIDPDGQSWFVPKGTKTDGASVPRAFFTLYAPFSGAYRKAALIHDYFCQTKTRTWRETHDTFYFALRSSNVSEVDSQVMWGSVLIWGPRWDLAGNRSPSLKSTIVDEQAQIEEIKRLQNWIKLRKPSIEELERALYTGSYNR